MRRFAVLSLLAVAVACQPAPPKVDAAAEEAAIIAQVEAFNAAVAAYDGSALGAIYAPDAILLAPNQGRLQGTEDIKQFFQGMQQVQARMIITPVAIEVAASGEMALEEGTWASSIPLPDGTTSQDNGKYLVGWKKVNGTWLIQIDSWNSDNAPPN